jgi:hypothetical protein
MCATIHVVSKRDYWPFAVAIRAAQRDWWLRVHKPKPDVRRLESAAAELRSLLASGPRRREELVEVTGRTWGMLGPWLELVRVPPSGTWEQRRAHLFQTAERWIGAEGVSIADALDHLVRRYLGAFGPAAQSDVAQWAGVNVRDLAPAVDRLRLRRFRDEQGAELLDLPRAALPDPETPAPVRFLPTWDAVLLVHARRTGILPERYRSRVFSTKNPPSVPTFLVDGEVAGTWAVRPGASRAHAVREGRPRGTA